VSVISKRSIAAAESPALDDRQLCTALRDCVDDEAETAWRAGSAADDALAAPVRTHEAQPPWPSQNAGMRWLFVAGAVGFVAASAQTSAAAAGGWATLAPLPTSHSGGLAAVTGPDGHIYAIGGFSAPGTSSLNTAEAYTPGSKTWATMAPMPTARGDLAAAAGHDGRIYAMGGDGPCMDFSKVEAYTPGTNSWAAVASMPTSRTGLAAATGADGRLYAIGGRTCSGGVVATVEAYTPATNSWATVASMPTPREYLAAATGPDGRIYAIGGTSDTISCEGGSFFNTVEVYTPSSNSWVTAASMATPRSCLAAATGADGRIYAIGGTVGDGGFFTNSVEAYAPSSNSWATVDALPSPRSHLAAATGPDGRVYAIGGDGTGAANEAYDTKVSLPATPVPSAVSRPRPVVNTVQHPSGLPVPVIVLFAVAGSGVVVGAGLLARRRRGGALALARAGATNEPSISRRESQVIRRQAPAPDARTIDSAPAPVVPVQRDVSEAPVIVPTPEPVVTAQPEVSEAPVIVPTPEPVVAAQPEAPAVPVIAPVEKPVVTDKQPIPEAPAVAPVGELDEAAVKGPSATVFLCYRREDSSGYAGRLFDALVARFGENSVFMDIDTIAPGQDFVDVIEAALVDCEIVLVLIGPSWLNARDKRKRRRLDNPDDFVRMEIEGALSRGLRVLPVLVGGAEIPSSRELPPSLALLARRHAFDVSDRRWRYDVQALLAALLVQSKALAKAVAAGSPNEAHPSQGDTSLAGSDETA